MLIKQVNHSLVYKKELDGLRGIAILLVVFFHLWPNLFSFGFVGVDIFFVLSGYLITKIISNKCRDDKFSLYEFYRNRIRRIFPALVIVLFVVLVIGYFFLFPDEYKLLGKHLKSSVLFHQNFRLIEESGYWDKSGQLKPLLHYWSLSIEEQFYIIWPFIIILIVRTKDKYLVFYVFITLFLISLSFNGETERFYSSFSRFWELSAGATLVWLEQYKKLVIFFAKYFKIIWLTFLGAIGIFYNTESYNVFYMLFLVVTVGLLILSLSKRSDSILSNRFLVFFGLISYPLYLWHYPIISFSHIFGISVTENALWIIFISILLSYLTYRYIEVYARQQTNKMFILCLVMLSVLIAGMGQYIRKDGLSTRPSLMVNDEQYFFVKEQRKDQECLKFVSSILNEKPRFSYCRLTSFDASKNYVALIGDSHAHVLFSGFSKELKKYGFEIILLSNNGCPGFLNGAKGKTLEEIEKCQLKIEQIYQVLDNIPNLKKVIMANVGPIYTKESRYFQEAQSYIEPPSRYAEYFNKTIMERAQKKYTPEELYFESVESSVSYLTEKKIQVYFFLDNPELGFPVELCFDRPYGYFDRINETCSVSLEAYKTRMQEYREKAFKIIDHYLLAQILDPQVHLCDKKSCYGKRNDKVIYSDSHHLNSHGGEYIARKMIRQLVVD